MKVNHYFIILLLCICWSCQAQKEASSPALSHIIDSLKIPAKSIWLKIDKSAYQLSVMSDTRVLKSYPVVFGFNPKDDKRREGDGCTPEGEFKVLSKYPHKSWSKFIWVDYPTNKSWEKHNQAKKEGKIKKDATIGGEIGIHGVPGENDALIDNKVNWTLGCISLKTDDINEVYKVVQKGTRIQITP